MSGLNAYRFQHTICTDLLRRGVNLKTVQMVVRKVVYLNRPNPVVSIWPL